MKFSIVIPFYNAADTLERCLKSLTKQVHKDFEVILVDNNSTDRSPLIASCFEQDRHRFPVRLIHETAPGAGHARNTGIAAAKGEWIVFTDSDCIITPTWLEEYDHKISELDETIAALAGCIQFTHPANVVQTCASLFTLPPVTEEKTFSELTHVSGGLPTANLAVRKKVLDQVGGFSHGKTFGEDYRLCADIYEAGYRIHAFPKAVVLHIHRDRLKPFLRQAGNIGLSHAYCLRELSERKTVIELPRFTIRLPKLGRIWIDLNQADKKMFILLLPMLFWWPLIVLPLLYFSHLCGFCLNKCITRQTYIAPHNVPLVALALVAKSAAITWGSMKGSLKYRVICL